VIRIRSGEFAEQKSWLFDELEYATFYNGGIPGMDGT
jgi:hypothetical protein